jgi:hypothetical protein
VSTLTRSIIYWFAVWLGVMFLAPELLAHYGVIRLYTFSTTNWDVESEWHFYRLALGAFMLVLGLHLLFKLSAAALITVVILAVAALIVHLATGVPW